MERCSSGFAKIKVMIGGASASPELAQEIGVCYAANVEDAIKKAYQLLEVKDGEIKILSKEKSITPRERVKALFEGKRPDRIVRGTIGIDNSVVKEFGCKDAIEVAKLLELDVLGVSYGNAERIPSVLKKLLVKLYYSSFCQFFSRFFTSRAIRRAKEKSDLFILGAISSPIEKLLEFYGTIDKTLKAIYTKPENVKKLIERQMKFEMKLAKHLVGAGADGILITCDMAGSTLLFPHHVYYEFFFNPIAQLVKEIKRLGLPVILHSDGNIKELIDDLLGNEKREIGIKSADGKERKIVYQQLNVDGLQGLERPYFDLKDLYEIKIRYPEKILMGNISCYDIGRGNVLKVIEDTRKLKETLEGAAKDGGREYVNDIIGESNVTVFSGSEKERKRQRLALEALYLIPFLEIKESEEKEKEDLISFRRVLKTYTIGGTEIGSIYQGKIPLMIASMFYQGDGIVEDHESGKFDEKKALALLYEVKKLSEEMAIPTAIDIVASSPKAMEKYVEFITKNTSFYFLIDGIDPSTKIAGARKAKELNASDRAIYNSISKNTSKEEIQCLKEAGINSAIFMALSPSDRSALVKERNFEFAKKVGLEMLFIDTGVFDLCDIKEATKTIKLIKEKTGYPVGCAPVNVFSFPELKSKPKSYKTSAIIFPILFGADFIFFGPLEWAKDVYPSVRAITDIFEVGKSKTITHKNGGKKEPLQTLIEAIAKGNCEEVAEISKNMIEKYRKEQKMLVSLKESIVKGMVTAAKIFCEGKMNFREFQASSTAAAKAFRILEAYGIEKVKPTYAIGTIYPNPHSFGKEVVITGLKGAGFKVYDLGEKVKPEKFIAKVKELKPEILGISVYTTEGVEYLKRLLNLLKEEKLI